MNTRPRIKWNQHPMLLRLTRIEALSASQLFSAPLLCLLALQFDDGLPSPFPDASTSGSHPSLVNKEIGALIDCLSASLERELWGLD